MAITRGILRGLFCYIAPPFSPCDPARDIILVMRVSGMALGSHLKLQSPQLSHVPDTDRIQNNKPYATVVTCLRQTARTPDGRLAQ
jgi:hypothetical protein